MTRLQPNTLQDALAGELMRVALESFTTVSWEQKLQEMLDTDSKWFDRSYLIDWYVTLNIYITTKN